MSTDSVENFAFRLREEIDSRRMSLADAARAAGEPGLQRIKDVVSGKQRCPIDLLARLADVVDVLYILTGERGGAVSPDEHELLTLYRAAPLPVKMAAVGALQGGSQPPIHTTIAASGSGSIAAGGKVQQFNGPISGGNFAGRDVNNRKGKT
ncbi:MAG: helix-turn-helix domain-containing protein [Betaproteobacteria bacterium]|nr:helix-turn-helix domain-containing protein [Betaproteobacteria bacterium]